MGRRQHWRALNLPTVSVLPSPINKHSLLLIFLLMFELSSAYESICYVENMYNSLSFINALSMEAPMKIATTLSLLLTGSTLLSTSLLLTATPAQAADPITYVSRNVVLKRVYTPSLVAALAMGGQGFTTRSWMPPADLTSLHDSCKAKSAYDKNWFQECNPTGMMATINQADTQAWISKTFDDDGFTGSLPAITFLGERIRYIQSPTVIPVFGRGDHWVTISKAKIGYNDYISRDAVSAVWYDDGAAANDGAGNLAMISGWDSGSNLSINKFFRVLSTVGSCMSRLDCPTDPYIDRYVVLYDPPPGFSLTGHGSSAPEVGFASAPGFAAKGEVVTTSSAATNVQTAIKLAQLDSEPQVQAILRNGTVEAAYEVHSRLPEGRTLRSITVPIVDKKTGHALAFVDLDSRDGALLSLMIPSENFVYQPVTIDQAMQIATASLKPGERLAPATLRFDAKVLDSAARYPFQAFYEFPVLSGDKVTGEVARVTRNGGRRLERSAAAQ